MRKIKKDKLAIELERITKKKTALKLPVEKIAKLVKKIAKREFHPGGPYKNSSGQIDKNLNQQIYLFLKNLGVKMPVLENFLKIKSQLSIKRPPAKTTLDKKIKEIIALIPKSLPELWPAAKKRLKKAIKETATGNRDKQMFQMPHFFYHSINSKKTKVAEKFLDELGLMSAFFWTSFIVYDDFWDEDEKATAELLPLANCMARKFFSFFNDIFKEDENYYAFFKKCLADLDSANFLEITNRQRKKSNRYQDPNQKFYPSAGHLFAPLAIVLKEGYSFHSQETQKTISFFKNYLIARQISDDMHDIEEDWQRRHESLAVKQLKLYGQKENLNNPQKRNFIFWTKVIDCLCKESFKLLTKCYFDLNSNKVIKNKRILTSLCKELEKSARQALAERNKRQSFVQQLLSS